MNSPADWQLPEGIDQGLWHYVTDPAIADGYDAALAGSPLLDADLRFCDRHLSPPGRLIDLGCGTGRLLVRFARRGDWVLGVDLSEEMLRVAKDNAARSGVSIQLLRANLADLNCLADGSFDHAACLFSTLGMVVGREARRKVLRHAHRLLRPGGRFVLHVHNRWFNLWDRSGRRWLFANLVRSAVGRESPGDRYMPAYLNAAGVTLHLFTRREAIRELRAAGFRVDTIQSVGLQADASLRWAKVLPSLRAYGYLLSTTRC
jgi:ubiquinone/menaquinone biosynthesis C-methylase UbiE